MGVKILGSVIAGTVLLIGCTAGVKDQATHPAGVASKPVYVSQGMPAGFDERELAEIRLGVELAGFHEKDVWFVHTLRHEGGRSRVTIYLLPERWSGRVVRGKLFRWDDKISIEQRRELFARLGERWPVTGEYVQVLPTGVPEAQRGEQREGAALPFAKPVGFSDEELAAIIDAARGTVKDPEMPVHSVQKKEDGALEVWFGELHGPLDGQGKTVTLKRVGNGYEAGEVGFWVS